MEHTKDPWSDYLRLQKLAGTISHCGAREYAVDAALDYLIDNIAKNYPPSAPEFGDDAVQRVMATAARRYRHQHCLMRKQPPPPDIEIAGKAEARLQLVHISETVSAKDCALLAEVGQGYTDREIGERHGRTAGAVRATLARIRQKLAA